MIHGRDEIHFVKAKPMNDVNIELKKRVLDTIGGYVDMMFLSIPAIHFYFSGSGKKIDRSFYEKQLDFYFENGYVKEPRSFFQLPDKKPEYRISSEKKYRDGRYQVIEYPSDYHPRNPMLRESFNACLNNQTAYLTRWFHGDSNRKTLLCIHGFMFGDPKQAEKMFKIEKLFDMGLDVVQFVLPLHWKRSFKTIFKKGRFFRPDNVAMSLETVGQAVYDLYNAFHILEGLSTGPVGMVGASLGGYHSALYACLDHRPAFAAFVVPSVTFSKPFGPDDVRLPFHVDPAFREKMYAIWELHSPLNFMPKVPLENMLFIASRGDRLCPFEDVNRLWQKWGGPKHQFMTGGHWLMFNPKAKGSAWYRFLADMDFV